MTTPLPDDILKETYDAFLNCGRNQTRTAEFLNISRSALQDRLRSCTMRGIDRAILGDPLPIGLSVKGVSTLYDAEGQVRGQWVKAQTEPSLEDRLVQIADAFKEIGGLGCWLPYSHDRTHDYEKSLATVYPIADLHLGMYSWADETGQDFDLAIADKLLRDTMTQLVFSAPASEQAVVLNLGDFFHSDSNENRTRRSGAPLDVDTRYAKVLKTGVNLMVATIQLALQKHKFVLVRNLPGNHDPYAAIALTAALSAYFTGSERVTVDESPSPFWFWLWGKTLLGATHGDMAKVENLPGIMAATVPALWGQSTHRYCYAGHWHSAKKAPASERAGAQIEVFQTLAPKDAWNNSMGFVSGRSMHAITFHKERGEVSRVIQSVNGGE